MTPKKEHHFEKSYAPELLRIAEGDLISAQALRQVARGRPENIVFHAHQTMEKSLKAALVHLELGVPLVHDLGVLIARLPDSARPARGYELMDFNDYAAILRYREAKVVLESSDIDLAIAIAEELLRWAQNLVAKG